MAVHFDLLELYHFDNVVLLSVLVLRRLGLTAVSVVNFNLLEFYLGAPGSGPQARDYDRRGRISASRWFWPGRTPDAKPDVDLSTGSSMRSDHGLRLLKISLDLGRPPGWDAGPGCIRPPARVPPDSPTLVRYTVADAGRHLWSTDGQRGRPL